MFAINVRKLFRKAFGPWVMPSSPRPQPRPSFRPSLESLERRVLLSASPLALPDATNATAQMTAALNQGMQLMATVEQDLSNAWNLIAQEVSYAQQQWMNLLGIIANAQASALGASLLPTGSGTAMTHEAPSNSAPVSQARPQGSAGPLLVALPGYLWDPVNGTNASDGHNWDYKGKSQKNVVNPLKPGDTPEAVYFDPVTTQGLNNNGASPITWDYSPGIPLATSLGSKSAYTSQQTINSGVTVDTLVSSIAASDLNLKFTSNTSKFQIDGDSTISNMHLGGSKLGQFVINSGTTTIAQSNTYTELDGVAVTIAKGATLSDLSECPLKFWASNININVQGQMLVSWGPNATNTLININGNTQDYIDVNGGSLGYNGKAGQKDTFSVPVLVEKGGQFLVVGNGGGWLIVTGNLNGTAPGVSNNASVYMKDDLSLVALDTTATLECDGDYYQTGGTLESTDASVCTLQDGPTGALGTATIAGGVLAIDYNGGYAPGSFGFFNINCGQLNLNGTYQAHIAGNRSGPLTNDVLTINQSKGTLNLQGGSTLTVFVDNPPPAGQQFTWPIIKAGKFLNPQFNTTGSVPNTPGLKYGPAGATEYDVTF